MVRRVGCVRAACGVRAMAAAGVVALLLMAQAGRSEGAGGGAAEEVIDLVKLPVGKAVTASCFSEDGALLFMAHEADGVVSVWDVAGLKEVATIKVASPRAMIHRKGRLYVTSFGQEKMSVFAGDAQWKALAQVAIEDPDVFQLTAAQGAAFDGWIYAAAGSFRERYRHFRVHVEKGTREDVAKNAMSPHLVVSRDGLTLLGDVLPEQGKPGLPVWKVYREAAGPATQVGPTAHLFGLGLSTVVVDKRFGKLRHVRQIGDVTAPVAYAVEEEGIRIMGIGAPMRELAFRRFREAPSVKLAQALVPLTQPLAGNYGSQGTADTAQLRYGVPAGVTIKGTTTVFLPLLGLGEMHYCRMAAVAEPETAVLPVAGRELRFEDMALPYRAYSGDLSEDGRTLFVLHGETNAVSVWDVATRKMVGTFSCVDPVLMVARGDEVVTINERRDCLSVVRRKGERWELASVIRIERTDFAVLQAAAGTAYEGKVLVVGQREQHKMVAMVVETGTGKVTTTPLGSSRVAMTVNGAFLRGGEVMEALPEAGFADAHGQGALGMQDHWGEWRTLQPGKGLPVRSDPATGKRYNLAAGWHVAATSAAGEVVNRWKAAVPDDVLKADPTSFQNPGQDIWLLPSTIEGKTHLFRMRVEEGRIMAACVADTPAPLPAFRAMSVPGMVTNIAVSEDGKRLYMAQQARGRVTVWDVATGKQEAAFDTPAPSDVLVRGNRVYVANFGKGTVSVYGVAEKYRLLDELTVAGKDVWQLSAPVGKHFGQKLLVVALDGEKPMPGKRGGYVTYMVDAAKDVSTQVLREAGVWSADGKVVATLDSFVDPLTFAQTGAGPRLPPFSIPRNVYPGGFWTGVRFWASADGRHMMSGREAIVAVPDVSQPAVYVLMEHGFDVVTLSHGLMENVLKLPTPAMVARVTHADPEALRGKGRFGSVRVGGTPSLAVTLGEKCYMFLLDDSTGVVFRAEFPKFPEKPVTVAVRPNPPAVVPPVAVRADPPKVAPVGEGEKADALGLPAKLSEGVKVVRRLMPAGTKGQFEVIKGPKGLTVGTDGTATWTPSRQEVGRHEIKIRAQVSGETRFLRYDVDVFSSVAVDAAGGDPTKISSELPRYALKSYAGFQQVRGGDLLVWESERVLHRFDASGKVLLHSVPLALPYSWIGDRPGYLVGACANTFDLLNRKTGKVERSIKLPGTARSVALRSDRKVAYVTVQMPQTEDFDLDAQRVVEVDEETGTVRMLPRVLGYSLALSPQSDRLFTSVFVHEPRPGMEHIEVRKHYVAAYRITDRGPVFESMRAHPAYLPQRIFVSGDGQWLSFQPNRTVSGSEPVVLSAKALGAAPHARMPDVLMLDWHPYLPLVVGRLGDVPVLLDRNTGKMLPERKLAEGLSFKTLNAAAFSPDGTRLVLSYFTEGGHSYVESVPLPLHALELDAMATAKAALAIAKPAPVPAGPAMPRLAELDALRAPAANAATMDTKQINKAYSGSVVLVRGESSFGTGFVVGRSGYVLTCAHVLPTIANPEVVLPPTGVEGQKEQAFPAQVLAVDEDLDIALLKVTTPAALVPVQFPKGDLVETGEPLTVIGNPGGLGAALVNTVTSGIVSNARRELAGRTFVQTNATVNPGNSGGPMFDGHGRVVGMVILKDRSKEGIALGVPLAELRKFLLEAVRDAGGGAQPARK